MSDRPFATALTRRRIVQLAGAGAGAFALAGRSSNRVSAQEPSGELTIGTGAASYRTDPNRATIGMYSPNVNIFESLVRITPEYQVEPMLAESWEFVEPNTWRFVLRQGVTFHDGTPLTAEAVKWSMGRIAAAGGGSIGVDENSVAIVDDYTVEITPARPNRRLVQQLNHPVYSIVAPNSEPADVRIGTGPFRETEYVVDDHYTVEAYEGYWGEKPLVQKLTFRFYADPTTRVLALQSGDVDLIVDVPKESASDLTATGDFQLLTSTVGAYNAIYVGIHGRPPYDLGQDKAIRQAVAHAIDKEAIVQGVWQGNAEVGRTMIPPAILGPAGDQITGVPYDPEQAKTILEQAGWTGEGTRQKDGRELKLTYVVGFPDASVHVPVPEFVQAQLAEVGIAVEIVQTPDTATYEARLQAGEGDLWAEQGNQNDGNPCFLPDLLFYTAPPDADPESAMYGNMFAPGPAFDAHIDTCRSAVSTEEVQEAAAMAVKILIDEEFVVIPIAGTYRIYGAATSVTGLEPHPSGLNQRWTAVSAGS
jgi:peptide/nickel transport system substrate-binding protein